MNAKVSTAISFLDPLSRFILVPFAFRHLQLHLNLSQSLAISNYGVMICCLSVGRTIGRNVHMGRKPVLSKQFANISILLIALSFLLLGFTSRVSIICMCYFIIGLAGGIIRASCFKDEDDLQSISPPTPAIGPLSPYRYADVAALALTFSPLCVAWTYHSAGTSKYPSFILCLGVCCVCVAIVFLSCQSHRKHKHPTGPPRTWRLCGISPPHIPPRNTIHMQTTTTPSQGPPSLPPTRGPLVGVCQDDLDPPPSFLRLGGGDRKRAQAKYYQTLLWRHEQGIDAILDMPAVCLVCLGVVWCGGRLCVCMCVFPTSIYLHNGL